MVSAILSFSPPILKDSAMLHVRQGVITKAADFALSVLLFSAEDQGEEYVKTMSDGAWAAAYPMIFICSIFVLIQPFQRT